jgi:hypothetical protein
VIAHRLSTVARSDLILVVEDGRVVQRGTHSKLLAQSGAYRELVQAQAGSEAGGVDASRPSINTVGMAIPCKDSRDN